MHGENTKTVKKCVPVFKYSAVISILCDGITEVADDLQTICCLQYKHLLRRLTKVKLAQTWSLGEKVFSVQTPTNSQIDQVYVNVAVKREWCTCGMPFERSQDFSTEHRGVHCSFELSPLTPTVARAERQNARMSKITNDVLTRSGKGCFIAVPIWQQ